MHSSHMKHSKSIFKLNRSIRNNSISCQQFKQVLDKYCWLRRGRGDFLQSSFSRLGSMINTRQFEYSSTTPSQMMLDDFERRYGSVCDSDLFLHKFTSHCPLRTSGQTRDSHAYLIRLRNVFAFRGTPSFFFPLHQNGCHASTLDCSDVIPSELF